MTPTPSPDRFTQAWDDHEHAALGAQSRGDHLAWRASLSDLARLAFQGESDKPLERLIALGWTPWMQEAERFFPLFHANTQRALDLFERFPSYSAWFPLTAFLVSRHDGARMGADERLLALDTVAQSPCFESQPFRPLAQDAAKLLSPLSLQSDSHPSAEAFLRLRAWGRANRAECLDFCSALFKNIPLQAGQALLPCAASALIRSQGAIRANQAAEAKMLLERLAYAGLSPQISELRSLDPAFEREISRPGVSQPPRRQQEVADFAPSLLNSYLAGRALMGPNPQSVKTLLDIGAPRPGMRYWRDEKLSAPQSLLQDLKKGGPDGVKAARKLARAKALLPSAIEIDPQRRDALIRALDGEANELSHKDIGLRIGYEAGFAELALVALLSERVRSASPSRVNWAALGPALSSTLEPGERLADVVRRAFSLMPASKQNHAKLPEEFQAYLEGLEIMAASQDARPAAAPAPSRPKL